MSASRNVPMRPSIRAKRFMSSTRPAARSVLVILMSRNVARSAQWIAFRWTRRTLRPKQNCGPSTSGCRVRAEQCGEAARLAGGRSWAGCLLGAALWWLILGLGIAWADVEPAPEADTGLGAGHTAIAHEYMAVTANAHATSAALEVLAAGGSAVDAAIAAQ